MKGKGFFGRVLGLAEPWRGAGATGGCVLCVAPVRPYVGPAMITPPAGHRFVPALAAAAALVAASSCASQYRGYQTRPYTIRGVRYTPLAPRSAVGLQQRGVASWYDERKFLWWGGETSLGEPFRAGAMAGAHKTLPLPCRVRVTNLRNRRSATVRLNDRGPFVAGRIIDLTPAAARRLGFKDQGLAPVEIKVLSVGDGRWRVR